MGRLTLGFFKNVITTTAKAEVIVEIINVSNTPSMEKV
jgi:hypothetical protein